MSVLFVLIGVSMLVAGGFLIGFLWAVKKGQYDDSYSPSVRILFEDKEKKAEELLDLENTAKKNHKS
ncbi:MULTISPECIES: cbb3-type cytochrome oxidase assembly protein CcoS [Marinifilum]|uniref:Cbb3-type cytochrome oxidase assembly protein CcoS n=1 Tax=Marinifilum breve TaxID=2184082 RepID=A0A2V3ZWE5_9BACT|nr:MULTISPECIES: cbb3-type cytochrome oxidase assembly protein CcoS [Marinifilum]MCY1632856.1 cbb3-type cytochrome oxidase assembly protein CcoS [Marinifilum sp. D737]MDQ2180252.1 cbb3-type cytochrome oxidase assembly protein CcoS [Marinifilum sp. D714]PXY00738.1 cbb3-type cytochrome oxidase assembly protein CcoS [Marinifilum breve]